MEKKRNAQSASRAAVFNLLRNHKAFVWGEEKRRRMSPGWIPPPFPASQHSYCPLFLSYKTHRQKTKRPTRQERAAGKAGRVETSVIASSLQEDRDGVNKTRFSRKWRWPLQLSASQKKPADARYKQLATEDIESFPTLHSWKKNKNKANL